MKDINQTQDNYQMEKRSKEMAQGDPNNPPPREQREMQPVDPWSEKVSNKPSTLVKEKPQI